MGGGDIFQPIKKPLSILPNNLNKKKKKKKKKDVTLTFYLWNVLMSGQNIN